MQLPFTLYSALDIQSKQESTIDQSIYTTDPPFSSHKTETDSIKTIYIFSSFVVI